MPAPEFPDLTDAAMQSDDDHQLALLVDKLDQARTQAAYWAGRCEGLELAMAKFEEGYDTTLAYLKDRLNRLEARERGVPP
jgi:hypothetical protein